MDMKTFERFQNLNSENSQCLSSTVIKWYGDRGFVDALLGSLARIRSSMAYRVLDEQTNYKNQVFYINSFIMLR